MALEHNEDEQITFSGLFPDALGIKSNAERKKYVENYTSLVRRSVATRDDVDQFFYPLNKCLAQNSDEQILKNEMFKNLLIVMNELPSLNYKRPPITREEQQAEEFGQILDADMDVMDLAARAVKKFDKETGYGEVFGLKRSPEQIRLRNALDLRSKIHNPGK